MGRTQLTPVTISTLWLRWMFVAVSSSCLLAGCVRDRQGLTGAAHGNDEQLQSDEENRAALRAALERAAKAYEERLNGKPPSPSEFPFPNYETGPGRPRPTYVNSYRVEDNYPTYLLCIYDVEGKQYRQTNEPGWFKKVLCEIRRLGPYKFPPIEWVVVIILNRGDGKHVQPLDKWYPVGTIFKAGDVFDSSHDLSDLVAHAQLDRHPFLFDPYQPTLDAQRKWMILERHAATNLPPIKPN